MKPLLGVRIPLPIHTSTTFTIANSSQGKLFRNITPAKAAGNYTVLWEVHNNTGVFPDCVYADVAVYTALEFKLEGNSTGAQHEMECLNLMFDGKGMVDEAYKDGSGSEHGIYQTYKLALYFYALRLKDHTITERKIFSSGLRVLMAASTPATTRLEHTLEHWKMQRQPLSV
jgi:hypothetical protein